MSQLAPEWLAMRAARRPHEPALRGGGVAWDRSQLLEAADALACALAGEGIAHGDRVAGLLDDDVPAVVLIEAARRLGVVLVPLNRRLSAAELRAQLAAVDAAALLHDRRHAALAADSSAPSLRSLALEPLLAGAPCAPRPPLRDDVDLDAPAFVVFTSGTSGQPRGALLTHRAVAASAHAWSHVLHPLPGDRWLACLPLFHVAGLAVVTRAGRWGSDLEILPRFEADVVSAALDDGATHVSLVPAQLRELLAARDGRPVPPKLRAVLLGGGPIPVDLLGLARDAGYPVLTTYGMTETGSGIAVGGADAATLDDPTAGRPLPGVELRIEPDGPSRADTTAHAPGEILVRGEMLFTGYIGDPAATATALRDGWLHTGDVGTLGGDGLLRVLDRRDDLIISGGENIAPAEVEAALASHPAVAEVAVVGVRDERWGAVPVAVVVLRSDAHASDETLRAHCRARLAGYKVPARIELVPALPRNAFGKIRRSELRERLTRRAT